MVTATGAQRFFFAGKTRFATEIPPSHDGLTIVIQMTDSVLLNATRTNHIRLLAVMNQTKRRQMLREVPVITSHPGELGDTGDAGAPQHSGAAPETPTALTKKTKYPGVICLARRFYRVMLQLKQRVSDFLSPAIGKSWRLPKRKKISIIKALKSTQVHERGVILLGGICNSL